MNTFWSDEVQGKFTLYLSRKLRFNDLFFKDYDRLFKISHSKKIKILEIGSGPGALAEVLKKHYPKAAITAIDRDSSFIEFAKNNISGINFINCDASELPFPSQTFDVAISYTVQEHIDPAIFWGEQKRVLKPGGICLCLSARQSITVKPACLSPTPEEDDFWRSFPNDRSELIQLGVGKYRLDESSLPLEMEKHGFTDITTGYVVSDLTPDDPKYSPALAEEMIDAERQADLEAIKSTKSPKANKIAEIVNAKYDRRLKLYEKGVKLWDTTTSLSMVVRGIKK